VSRLGILGQRFDWIISTPLTVLTTRRKFTPLLPNRHLDVTDFNQANGKEEIWPVAQITWGLLEPGSPQFVCTSS
jgi:hypothetical protein